MTEGCLVAVIDLPLIWSSTHQAIRSVRPCWSESVVKSATPKMPSWATLKFTGNSVPSRVSGTDFGSRRKSNLHMPLVVVSCKRSWSGKTLEKRGRVLQSCTQPCPPEDWSATTSSKVLAENLRLREVEQLVRCLLTGSLHSASLCALGTTTHCKVTAKERVYTKLALAGYSSGGTSWSHCAAHRPFLNQCPSSVIQSQHLCS